MSFYGINQEETIEAGEIRKLEIELIEPYGNTKPEYPVSMWFQLFIQEGKERIIVIDWENIHRVSNSYYIILDTSWLIPNMYYIDVKYEYGNETRKILDLIKFKLVNKIVNHPASFVMPTVPDGGNSVRGMGR